MSVMLQSLNNIRTLRAMAREFSIDVLEEMLEKFRVVTKERREEEEQQQRELAERQDINSPMLTVKLKPGPVRAVHRSQLLRRWQKVNLSTIS